MKTWRLLFFLAALAAAHAQTSTIQFPGGPYKSPNPLQSCGSQGFNTPQTAGYDWTLYCIVDGNFIGYNGGLYGNGNGISGTANGACPGGAVGGYCGGAPAFSPTFQPQGAFYGMWVNLTSGNLQGQAPNYSCGPNTYSAGPTRSAVIPSRCQCDPTNPDCKGSSPIVIDVSGESFFLTDQAHGVQFRKGPASQPQLMSWTDPAHHNAWLVRPNADGSVTSLSMNMFGNLSPQPQSSSPNGYSALAYWASQEGCGKVTKLDLKSCSAVWQQLRLWHDANQDGIAQPSEMQTLEDAGIHGISLIFHESRYIDQFGNMFRYDSQIFDENNGPHNRCYDVWLEL